MLQKPKDYNEEKPSCFGRGDFISFPMYAVFPIGKQACRLRGSARGGSRYRSWWLLDDFSPPRGRAALAIMMFANPGDRSFSFQCRSFSDVSRCCR